jgi:hypothetical protein
MSLPDEFRNDRNPFIMTNTSTSAKDLEEALYNKFEGLLWISNEIEKNRSATYFIQRLKSIIERAGMKVKILTQQNITINEVNEIKQLDNEYKDIAEIKRSESMATNLGRRLTEKEYAEENNVTFDETNGIKTEKDKLGDKARYICKSLNIVGQCLLEDLKDDTKKIAEWLNYYEPYTEKFKNMNRLLINRNKKSEYDLQTTSQYEADNFIKSVLKSLNIDIYDLAENQYSGQEIKELDTNIIDLTTNINKHCSRLFNEPHGNRREQVILTNPSEGRKRQTIISSINVVLSYIGAVLKPQYKTKQEKNRGTPSSYKLSFDYLMENAPSPIPSLC